MERYLSSKLTKLAYVFLIFIMLLRVYELVDITVSLMFRESYPKYKKDLVTLEIFMAIFILLYVFVAFFGFIFTKNPTIGLTQPGRCLANSNYYNVHDWINSTLTHLSNPIVYDGADSSCIDEKHLQSCDALRTDQLFQLSAELFVRHFKISDGLFYPYFIFVFFTCFAYLHLAVHSEDLKLTAEARRQCSYVSKATGYILALFIFLSSYSTKFMFIESCNSIMVSLDEAAVFCRTLTSCGLTLASVYSANGTTAYGYSSVIIVFGVIEVVLHTCHLPLMLLHDWHTRRATQFEADRLAILSKQGDELSAALETAPPEFVTYYLTDWKPVKKPKSASRATPAVYSPISTTDSTSDRAMPPVLDIEQDDGHCTVCQNILFTADGGRRVIELHCHHTFHQTCILHWAIVATNTGCPICRQKLK